jgi:hypothetical protein
VQKEPSELRETEMTMKKFTTAIKERVELPAPAVTINTVGKIIFNKGAEANFKLANLKYAILWFDDKRNIVSISFTTEEDEDGAMPMKYTDKTGYYINAKSFMTWAKIPHERSASFPLTLKNNNQSLNFTVKKNQMKSKPK